MRWDYVVFFVCWMGYIGTVCGFCGRYLAPFRWDKKVFLLLLFGIEAGVNFNGSVGMPYFLSAVTSHVLFSGLILAAFSAPAMKKLFGAALCVAAKTLVWNFGECFFSCIALVGTRWATNAQVLPPWLTGVIGGVSYCLVAGLLILLQKKAGSLFARKSGSFYLLLSALLFGIVAVVDVVNWGSSNGIMVVARGMLSPGLYYDQIFSHLGICLVTVLLSCIAGGLLFFMDKVYLEQQKKEEYSAQIAFYRMLDEQYLQMERLRHDMKNHVLALRGLWEQSEFEEAGAYLERMMESGNIDGDEVTGNRAVDALLHDKKRRAEELSVSFHCDVQISGESPLDTFDLCVLLGNLLDNAIKAGSEVEEEVQRFVELQARQVKKCFLLVVKNGTALGDIGGMKRGIGTLNIDETVRRYGGTVKRSVKDHVFEVSVLFPCGEDGQNGKETV